MRNVAFSHSIGVSINFFGILLDAMLDYSVPCCYRRTCCLSVPTNPDVTIHVDIQITLAFSQHLTKVSVQLIRRPSPDRKVNKDLASM